MRRLLILISFTAPLAAIVMADLRAFPEKDESPDPLPVPQYDQLRQWRFSEEIPLPPGGITLESDTATWILKSGFIRLMEPTDEGAVTGLVFKGQGRFRIEIPGPVEWDQLDRFSGMKLGGKTSNDLPIRPIRRTGERSVKRRPEPAVESNLVNSTDTLKRETSATIRCDSSRRWPPSHHILYRHRDIAGDTE